jgi:APA family basic amino acid/polyamine antiporter
MSENPRDSGLVRVVGPWALAASIVSIVVGAGIFAVPGALAASIGAWAPAAFLGCGLAVGAVAICFAEGGSRIPTSGGVYGYIEVALGPLTGHVAGMLLLVADVLACGGIAAALADVVVSLVTPPLVAPVHAAVIVGAIGGIAAVNVAGVGRGARLVGITTVLKLIPLAIFVLAGVGAIHGDNLLDTTQPTSAGVGRAVILALFAFIGMETPLCASGEVARPSRTIPVALALAMVSVTILYVAVQVVAQGIMGPALAHSTVPLADAMARIHPPLRVLMLAGAALSMFGWIGGDILGTPRQLFAFARDGRMPRVLGRLHAHSHAPHIAIICYAGVAIVVALTGSFAELAVLATLASAALYIAGCVAAWLLARRDVALAGEPLRFRLLGPAAALGIASMLALIALASRPEILGLAGLIGASVLIHLIQQRVIQRRAHPT